MIIVIGGQKGGTGKSNIAYNLAGAFKARGNSVVLLDADKNATCVNKASRRKSLYLEAEENGDMVGMKRYKMLPVIGVRHDDDIRLDIKEHKNNYDVVIVDTGGYESKAFKSSVMVSDTIVIPTQLSQDDIEQLDPLFNWLRNQESDIQLNHPEYLMNTTVLFSKVASFQGRDRQEAREFLSDYSDLISISDISIKERSDMRRMAVGGLTYHDIKHRESASFDLLISELVGERTPTLQRELKG
jgi:chromosome partitioning protein